MSRLIFQKYLDWVNRYFYQSSGGIIPPVNLNLSVDHDWPLETSLVLTPDYATIAGTLPTTIYAPALDRHGLVYLATVSVVAVNVPATDQVGLLLRHPNGDGARPFEMNGVAVPVGSFIPMIGGTRSGGAAFDIFGAPPVYVGPGQELRIIHTSVAGGSTMRPRVWVVDRPAYYPLRLP